MVNIINTWRVTPDVNHKCEASKLKSMRTYFRHETTKNNQILLLRILVDDAFKCLYEVLLFHNVTMLLRWCVELSSNVNPL
jgi:hypothetical protein